MSRKSNNNDRSGRRGAKPGWGIEHDSKVAHIAERVGDGHPDDSPASLHLQTAGRFTLDGRYDLADHAFHKALAAGHTVTGLVHSAYAAFLFMSQRDTDALDVVEQARKLSPNDPEVVSTIALTLLAYGHPALAARWFSTGLVHRTAT